MDLMVTNDPYNYDYFTIKKYTDDYYKITYHKSRVMKAGYELVGRRKKENIDIELQKQIDIDNMFDENKREERLCNSISRSRSKIFEYALCNEFDYFVTLTLDKTKYDRYNLKEFIKDLGRYIRNYRDYHKIDVQYLLIPEMHKDGAWHLHGLLKGVPLEHLKAFTLTDSLPTKLKKLLKKGRDIYNWENYARKFGYCTFEKVINQMAISKYITKYISKDLGSGLDKSNKLYYSTRGLKTAKKIHSGSLDPSVQAQIVWDFENDYVSILSLNKDEYNNFIKKHDLQAN